MIAARLLRRVARALSLTSGSRHVDVVQSTVANPSVWVTWDRNDYRATKFEVLRDGAVIATIGPFVPYDPANATHRVWNGTGSAPFDDTWNKCAYEDTGVTGGSTYAYSVRAYRGSTVAGVSRSSSIRVERDSDYGAVVNVAAPSGGDDLATLNAAITTVKNAGGGVVVLQAGTYLVSAKLSMQAALSGNVLLRGQGKDVTKIAPHSSFAAGVAGSGSIMVEWFGAETGLAASLAVAAAPGDRTLTLDDASGVQVGSVIRLVGTISGSQAPTMRAATPGLIQSPGGGRDDENQWESGEVVGVSGNVVTLKQPITQHFQTLAQIVAAGAGALRGTWVSGTSYVVGDVVFDSGASIPSYYRCTSAVAGATKPSSDTSHWTLCFSLGRISESALGTRRSRWTAESLTFEGTAGTTNSNDYWKLTRVEACVKMRFAKVRWRYANQHAVELRTNHDVAIVDCDEPHHGNCVTSQQQYTISGNRTGNGRIIACSFGTDGSQVVTSTVTFQRCPRWLNRHCTVYYPFNYAFDEHGANTRDWIVENCYMKGWPSTAAGSGTKRGLVFMGNSSFSGGGRGLIRNNRVDGGPAVADMQENSYGVRVLDNIAVALAPTGNSPASALCKGYGWDAPDDASSDWGAIRWTIQRNAMFACSGDGIDFGAQTSNFFGDGTAGNPDQAGDGAGYLGVKDVIVDTNHFDVKGIAVRLRGSAARTLRFQVRLNTGAKRYLRPALSAGCHWSANADAGGYTATVYTRDFGADGVANTNSWEPPSGTDAAWVTLVRANANSPKFTVVLSTTYKGRTSFFLASDTPNVAVNLRPETLDDSTQRRTLVYSTTNPGSRQYGLCARHGGGAWDSDCYFALLTNAATPTLEIFKRVTTQTATTSSTTVTSLGSVNLGALTNNVDTLLVLDVAGTTIRAKAYQGVDPGTWAISVTDSAISTAGMVGVYDAAPAAQSNSFDTKKYELLSGSKAVQADYGAAAAVTWAADLFEWESFA